MSLVTKSPEGRNFWVFLEQKSPEGRKILHQSDSKQQYPPPSAVPARDRRGGIVVWGSTPKKDLQNTGFALSNPYLSSLKLQNFRMRR